MLTKSLYVAAAVISLAVSLPAQARDNGHDNRNHKHGRKTIVVEQNIQYNRYINRDDRHDRRDEYREQSHHREAYRDDRRYAYDVHRSHYVYYPELHLLNHLIVALANR